MMSETKYWDGKEGYVWEPYDESDRRYGKWVYRVKLQKYQQKW